jgi:hypothetical protein
MSYMTVLTSTKFDHLGKTFYKDREADKAPKDFLIKGKSELVESFHAMASVLKPLLGGWSDQSYIIRGQPLPKYKAKMDRGESIRRLLKKGKDGHEPTFEDAPVNYLCIDSDDLEYPQGMDKREAIQYLINELPESFRNASCVYQYSSSAFMPPKKGQALKIKAHLWFWIEKPITSAQLREYFKREIKLKEINPKLVDIQAIRAVQPLYTAQPRFMEGAVNPMNDDERWGVIKGKQDHVDLPLDAYAEVKAQKNLARRNSGKASSRQRPIRQYFGDSTGYSDQDCQSRVEKAVSKLARLNEGRFDATYKTSVYIGGLVGAGRLKESEAFSQLEQAARSNGMIDKHGDKGLEQIIRGLAQGMMSPIYKEDNKAPDQRGKFNKPSIIENVQASSTQEINDATYKAIKEAIDNASSQTIQLAKIPTGAGKSYQALKILSELNKAGKTVIFTAPTYDALKESEARLKDLEPSIKPLLIKGQKRQCKSYMKSNTEQRLDLDEILEDRRVTDLCHSINEGRKCPFFDQCELRQKTEAEPLEGRFILAVHQMIGHLKELPDNAILVIDESPNFVYKTPVELRAIKALIPTKSELNKWAATPANEAPQKRSEQLDLFGHSAKDNTRPQLNLERFNFVTPSEEWRYLNQNTISPFAKSINWIMREVSRKQIDGSLKITKELIKSLTPNEPKRWENLKKQASKALEVIDSGEAKPNLLDVRDMFAQAGLNLASCSESLVKRSAVNMLKQCAELCLNDDDPALWLAPNQRGQLSLSKRYDLKLPELPCVVLDATAQVQSWTKVSGRLINVIQAGIVVKRRDGYHIKSRSLQAPQLWSDNTRTVLTQESFYRLNRITDLIAQALAKVEKGSPIGIGAAKPLRALIDSALSGQGQLAGSSLIKLLGQYQCITGHTGKDHAYTNKFSEAKVKAMIILGGQYPHYGEERADCEHLGANPDEVKTMLQERNEANMVQWHGRPRSLRREDEEIIHIEVSPKPTPIEWINWHTTEIRGRGDTSKSKEAQKLAQDILSAHGQIKISDLVREGVQPSLASRTIKRLDLERVIDSESPKKGRPSYIYKVKLNHIDNVFSQSFSESKTDGLTHEQTDEWISHSFELGESQDVITNELGTYPHGKTAKNHIDNVFSQSLQSTQDSSKKREASSIIIYSNCEKTLSIGNHYKKEQKAKGSNSRSLRVKQFETDIYDDIGVKQNDARIRQWALSLGAPEIRTQKDLNAFFQSQESTL